MQKKSWLQQASQVGHACVSHVRCHDLSMLEGLRAVWQHATSSTLPVGCAMDCWQSAPSPQSCAGQSTQASPHVCISDRHSPQSPMLTEPQEAPIPLPGLPWGAGPRSRRPAHHARPRLSVAVRLRRDWSAVSLEVLCELGSGRFSRCRGGTLCLAPPFLQYDE